MKKKKGTILAMSCTMLLAIAFALVPINLIAATTYLAPGYQAEDFLTLPFSTAAIAFDSDDNLYTSDLLADWNFGTINILKLEEPEYINILLYQSYDTGSVGLNGLAFDDYGTLFASEYCKPLDPGLIRNLDTGETVEFELFRPTGITATGFGTVYFPGRKWSDTEFGNIYKIDPFPGDEEIVREGVVGTAIAIDDSGNFFVASRSPDNSIYTRNPYTGDLLRIASFNQYVEELEFCSEGNLYALGASGVNTSSITKLIPPHVVIDGCDTGIVEWVLDDGDTITDKIEDCAATARNHGKFVSCVAKLTNKLRKAGIITGKEKGAIQRCAAQADLP